MLRAYVHSLTWASWRASPRSTKLLTSSLVPYEQRRQLCKEGGYPEQWAEGRAGQGAGTV